MKINKFILVVLSLCAMVFSTASFSLDMDHQEHATYQAAAFAIESDTKLTTADNHNPVGSFSTVSVIGKPQPSKTDLELSIGFNFMLNEHRMC